MAGARTRIRIGEISGAPYIEQVHYGVPADMQLLNKAKYEIEIEDNTAYVSIFLQLGDGSPTAITHSPFTGGKFDVGSTQASMKALEITAVALCIPLGNDEDGGDEVEEGEDDEVAEDSDEEEAEDGEEGEDDGEEGEDDGEEGEDDGEEGEDDGEEGEEDEGPTLGELADQGDKAAIKQLEAEARAAGINPDNYETYAEVEALLPEEGADDDEEAEEDEEE